MIKLMSIITGFSENVTKFFHQLTEVILSPYVTIVIDMYKALLFLHFQTYLHWRYHHQSMISCYYAAMVANCNNE